MSYDLVVRRKAADETIVPRERIETRILELPGITRNGDSSYVVDRTGDGIHIEVDIDDDDVVSLLVPYPMLHESGGLAFDLAFALAESLGWTVYDPQIDRELQLQDRGRVLDAHREFNEVA